MTEIKKAPDAWQGSLLCRSVLKAANRSGGCVGFLNFDTTAGEGIFQFGVDAPFGEVCDVFKAHYRSVDVRLQMDPYEVALGISPLGEGDWDWDGVVINRPGTLRDLFPGTVITIIPSGVLPDPEPSEE